MAAAAACCNGAATPTGSGELGSNASFDPARLRGRLGSGSDLDPAMVRSLFANSDLSSSLSALSLIEGSTSMLGAGSESGEKLAAGGPEGELLGIFPHSAYGYGTVPVRRPLLQCCQSRFLDCCACLSGSPTSPTSELRAALAAAETARATAVAAAKAAAAAGFGTDGVERRRGNDDVAVGASIFAEFGRHA